MPKPPMKRKNSSDRPVPGKGAAQGGDYVESRQDTQALASAEVVAEHAGAHGPNHRAPQRDRHGEAQARRE